MQAHTAATADAIAVFMPTLPPAAAADTTTQAMSKTDEHSPNRSPFFLIGMTELRHTQLKLAYKLPTKHLF